MPGDDDRRSAPLWPPTLANTMALGLLGLFAMVVICLLFVPMPLTEAAGTLLTALIGMLITKVGTMIDYFFGSSDASRDKDATIRKLSSDGHSEIKP